MPIYMKYADIKGDVTEKGHKDWIELSSFQWGVGRGVSTPTGGAKNREASAPSVSEIVVTKLADKATPDLAKEALQGKGKEVEISFCKTEAGVLKEFMNYKLTNTLISGFSTSSGGGDPTESLSLNFTKVEFSYTPRELDNAPASAKPRVAYDLAEAVAS